MEQFRCKSHEDIAIKCSRINELFDTLEKLDNRLNDLNKTTIETNSVISNINIGLQVLKTESKERWAMQKWWNISIAGIATSALAIIIIEWFTTHKL